MMLQQDETCEIGTNTTTGQMYASEAWNATAATTACTSLQHCREVCIAAGYKNYITTAS